MLINKSGQTHRMPGINFLFLFLHPLRLVLLRWVTAPHRLPLRRPPSAPPSTQGEAAVTPLLWVPGAGAGGGPRGPFAPSADVSRVVLKRCGFLCACRPPWIQLEPCRAVPGDKQ